VVGSQLRDPAADIANEAGDARSFAANHPAREGARSCIEKPIVVGLSSGRSDGAERT
jgi:hypothetical protein